MTARKTRDIGGALAKKGFRAREGDHTFYFLYVGERKTAVHTKISRGAAEYGGQLLGQMARELHLTSGELLSLVDCPLDGEAYVGLLVARGIIAGRPD